MKRMVGLILKLSYLDVTKDRYPIFIKGITLTTKIQIILLHHFDKSLLKFCADNIFSKLSKMVLQEIFF